ncbi:MAG: hypothetical protein IKT40_07540 [Bacilli bacterium]|nr:hypothetical protein [Bacilli bacterium]
MKNEKKIVTDSNFLYTQDEANHDDCNYNFGQYIEYNGLDVKNLKNQLIEFLKKQ